MLNLLTQASLPKIDFFVMPNSPGKTSWKASATKEQTVLIFSRDADTRFLLSIVLTDSGYRVLVSKDIVNCTEIIMVYRPDLILMDVEFPLQEDLSCLLKLRTQEEFRGIPITLISNYPSSSFRSAAHSLNAQEHLLKPIDFNLLNDTIKKIIKKAIDKNYESIK